MRDDEPASRVRLDKWLWAARFYKTRQLAAGAVSGGHVHVNGQRSKPAHVLNIGDVLKITKTGTTYIVDVTALAEKRGPASMAQQLYMEQPDSIAAREATRMLHRSNALINPHPARRPDKRQRRQLKAWQEKT